MGVATLATACAPGPIGEDLPVDNPFGIEAIGGLLEVLAGSGALLLPLGIASFISLFVRRRQSVSEHLQLRWFGFSLALACAVALLSVALESNARFSSVVGPLLAAAAVAVPAVGIAVAVLRHRLYEIDAVISRSATYLILSAGAAALALGSGAVVGAIAGRGSTAGALVTAVVVALAVRGSWQWVQRRVERAVYGERGDPLRAMRSLGDRLELAASIEDALEAAASTLATSLLLPFVSIRVRGSSAPPVVVGHTDGAVVSLPITTQGTAVADLEVGVRRGDAGLDGPDAELIGELARSIGPLCQAAVLAAELRHSLERIGQARDEERERIHRDLHDGLGPTLAGLAFARRHTAHASGCRGFA